MIIGISGPIAIAPLLPYLDVAPNTELPNGLGGIPIVALTEQLLTRGHRVVVFTLDSEVTNEVVLEGPHLKVCIGPYRPRARHRALDGFRVERNYLLSAMLREKTDFIHAHWTYEFALPALKSGRLTLITAHDAPLLVLALAWDAYRAVRAIMAFQVSRSATNMTAVSPDTARHFRRFLLHQGSIQVIPNCLSTDVLACRPRDFDVSSSGVVFGSALVGWGKMKNAKPALKAFALTRRVLNTAKFLMFGTGFEEGGPAHRWACRHRLDKNVEFIGSLPHTEMLSRLAREVDVLVHPSLHEALSGAVMEAMTLKLAVIAGRKTPGMSFLLEEGGLGTLVDVCSANELADAMIQLGRDSALRKRLGTAARESALRRFHADVVIPQYEREYAKILALSVGRRS